MKYEDDLFTYKSRLESVITIIKKLKVSWLADQRTCKAHVLVSVQGDFNAEIDSNGTGWDTDLVGPFCFGELKPKGTALLEWLHRHKLAHAHSFQPQSQEYTHQHYATGKRQ